MMQSVFFATHRIPGETPVELDFKVLLKVTHISSCVPSQFLECNTANMSGLGIFK